MKHNDDNTFDIKTIPKVTLHEHLEGTVSPAVAKVFAEKYHTNINNLIDGNNCYNYDKSDFMNFINAYDQVSNLVRDADDYYHATYSFLEECSTNNAIYAELIISPAHMAEVDGYLNPYDFKVKMDGIQTAMFDAKKNLDIESNLIATGVRNKDVANIDKISNFLQRNKYKKITGFGIAGNEADGSFAQFAKGFKEAKKMGLGLSFHAGEICGPQNVWAAIEYGATRIGHGIASIEDKQLLDYLAKNKILLEVCPTSNIVLVSKLDNKYNNHPLRKLYENGVKVSLNSDDAGLVGASLGGEYQVAKEHFGFNRSELLDITLCAIEAAFTDKKTKKDLFSKVYDSIKKEDLQEFSDNAKKTSNKILELRLKNRALGKEYE